MLRIALNGYGRIGRALIRALFERGLESQIHIEAINETGDFKTLAHLTRFDSTFGRFNGHVGLHDDVLQVRGQSIRLIGEKDMTQLPWKQLDVDVVVDCTVRSALSSGCESSTRGAPAARCCSASARFFALPVQTDGANQDEA